MGNEQIKQYNVRENKNKLFKNMENIQKIRKNVEKYDTLHREKISINQNIRKNSSEQLYICTPKRKIAIEYFNNLHIKNCIDENSNFCNLLESERVLEESQFILNKIIQNNLLRCFGIDMLNSICISKIFPVENFLPPANILSLELNQSETLYDEKIKFDEFISQLDQEIKNKYPLPEIFSKKSTNTNLKNTTPLNKTINLKLDLRPHLRTLSPSPDRIKNYNFKCNPQNSDHDISLQSTNSYKYNTTNLFINKKY